MIKKFPLVFSLLLIGCAYNNKNVSDCQTYIEATIPVNIKSDWNALPDGLQAAVGSINRRYEKHEIPDVQLSKEWLGTAWRGERVSLQLVLWSKNNVDNIQCEISDFRGTNGLRLSKEIAKPHFVRYVVTDEYADGCGERKPEHFASSLSADVLDNIGCFDMQSRTSRPIWITVDIPVDAQAGIYTSSVKICGSGKEMQAVLELLHETAPDLSVALADNHHGYKLYPDQIWNLCVAQGTKIDNKDREYRKEKGLITTWYVCCGQEFPNVFTFSDPAEATFIAWNTLAAGFDGFLRWAYNSWVKDPLVDSRFRNWPAGDTFIVYPGGRSSIRFERLREGIQDAEKIRILREEYQNKGSIQAKEKLDSLNKMVERFNITEKTANIEQMLSQGKELLMNLSK